MAFCALPEQRLKARNADRDSACQPCANQPCSDPPSGQSGPASQSVESEASQQAQTECHPEGKPTVVRDVQNRKGSEQVVDGGKPKGAQRPDHQECRDEADFASLL